jgi:hypothetical protein
VNDGLLIEVLYGGHDAIHEFLFGRDADVAQDRAGELGEEAFDKVEPGTVLGREGEFEAVGRLLRDPGPGLFGDVRGMIVGRRQAKLARSVGESPTQVKPSRRPGSECCVSRRQRRPRSVHSGCVGCVIESRNIFTAGAETVDKVERNMAMAAMRGHSHPAGV